MPEAAARASGHRDLWLVGSLLAVLLLIWLGYLWHRDPRFAGSPAGTALGVAAAVLMLAPALYTAVKRIPAWRARASVGTWLAWHIYLGMAGTLLGVLHSGHRFDSWVGQGLIVASLLVVLTGYVGRYLSRFVVDDVRTQKDRLARLQTAWNEMLQSPAVTADGEPDAPAAQRRDVDRLARALADARHAQQAADAVRAALRRWVVAHIALSLALYATLGLHIWSAWAHAGRWWP
jgi:hypothetical protein